MKKAMLTLGVAAVGSLLMVNSAFAAEANYLFKLPANPTQTVADPVADKSIEKYFPAILPTAQQQSNVTDSNFSKFFPAMLPVATQTDQPAANTIQKFYPVMLPTQEAAPASGNEDMKKFYPNVLPETTQEAPIQKPSHIIFG
ncbi:hypothetical protein [Brevibacillus laterosporus]|uniref:hypothetical protein n=1 Tax=Brevibacillus laterosporus TaxID=1465 RepID=UPI00264F9D1E|nr:hypothetical protein [Brevibacillus laterosporus]MDN9012789.1 hypothetical protein [Brevibacillus laterosporus]MDO0943855.1 hypothetical protein [Brevibacillus laterosporus]